MKTEMPDCGHAEFDRLGSAAVLAFILLAAAFTATAIWAIVRVVLFYT